MIEPKCEYEEGDIYYGSTIQPLSKRLGQHRERYKKNICDCKSSFLFEKYGEVKIVLIKLFPCNSKKELEAEEAKYIRENKCVNKYIPIRTSKEYYKDNQEKFKEYYKDKYEKNKEIIKEKYEKNKEKYKENYEKNKEKIKEYHKEYYEKNKEKIVEQKKEYYEKNKEKKKEYYEKKKNKKV